MKVIIRLTRRDTGSVLYWPAKVRPKFVRSTKYRNKLITKYIDKVFGPAMPGRENWFDFCILSSKKAKRKFRKRKQNPLYS